MCNCTEKLTYGLHREFVVKSNPRHGIRGASVLFQNQGNTPVHINDFVLLPGDMKKIDVHPPHFFEDDVNIWFDTDTVLSTGGSLRLAAGPKLYIEYLSPKT